MPRTRTSSTSELLLSLDRDSHVALHRQLERGLQEAIRSGRLEPGSPLPSTRGLAQELGLSRGVVVEAYEQLTAEGYLEARPGGATRVAERASDRPSGRRPPSGPATSGPAPSSAACASDGHRRRRPSRNGPEHRACERETGDVHAEPGPGPGTEPGPGPTTEPEPPSEDDILPAFAFARARYDFSYGRPDVTAFPRQAWLKALKRVLNEAPAEQLSYLDGRGSLELRQALASYLNRVRATSATPSQMVITNGFAQGQRLVMQVTRELGGKRVATEDPGQIDTLRAAELLKLEIVPVPVDDDGIDVGRLAESRADLCIVTPAHQFPTGAVMSAERRAALVRWARDRGAHILEDDYDAEYRYDREPIGAIQGLAPDCVIYGGSASKTLAPGLRLGWLILPARLVEAFATAKFAGDRGSPSLEQLGFADFLARGEFDRHLRRMRPIYRARRDALLRAVARYIPSVRPTGASAGLHMLLWLPPGVDEAAVVARAAELDVAIDGLTPYRSLGSDDPCGRGGLILGYARLTEREIDEGVERIAAAMA